MIDNTRVICKSMSFVLQTELLFNRTDLALKQKLLDILSGHGHRSER